MSSIDTATREAYEPDYEYQVEKNYDRINPVEDSDLTKLQLNGYIVRFIQRCKTRNFRDEKLWEEYIENFDKWTKETFSIPSREATKDLRDFLR